jgi:formimidoylglutamate deiminase
VSSLQVEEMMTALWFEQALLRDGWARDVRVVLNDGRIATITAGVTAEPGDECLATALPGLPNLHCHAFQRLMAGLAESRGPSDRDDFWSWRDLMYQLVNALSPDDVAAIAAMAYVEMLEAGFTRVGEFHYLHHQPSGTAYDDPAEMAVAIAAAAEETGIGLTLLPVFYAHSGLGGQDPNASQRRFVTDIDAYSVLLDASHRAVSGLPGALVGVAPHSLRAVTLEELHAVGQLCINGPIHIHIAEQMREVEDCLSWSGRRPVQWLFDQVTVDEHWCLVHATHIDGDEIELIAKCGAVVGLCPITEANLGDGLFPAEQFLSLGGQFGIGSDSNVRIDASEELRLLEYGQRLKHQRRNILSALGRSTGRTLFDAALGGGSRALGIDSSGLVEGAAADIVALAKDPLGTVDRAIDQWIFSRGTGAIEAVWRAGRRVVRNGEHNRRAAVAARYEATAARLLT